MGGQLRTAKARERLRRIAREAELKTHEAIRAAADHALEVARAGAPGRLPETLSVRPLNQYAVRVSSSSGVAIFHENGTAPHPIVAHGKVLAFQVNGSTVFVRAVQHPGTKALHFMRDGMEAGRALMRELLSQILR